MTSIDNLAEEIMQGLQEYADLADTAMKKAVRKSATQVKNEISANAPRDTGKYAKSWATKKTGENSHSLKMTVHSKNRYQLAHLLEKGHAKRGGGRVSGKPHIAPAEEKGVQLFEYAPVRFGAFADISSFTDFAVFRTVFFIASSARSA